MQTIYLLITALTVSADSFLYGLSFPSARQKAVEDIMGKNFAEILSSPNDILGIEYIKAILK